MPFKAQRFNLSVVYAIESFFPNKIQKKDISAISDWFLDLQVPRVNMASFSRGMLILAYSVITIATIV